MSDVYRVNQGNAVLQIIDIQPSGYKPLEEVKDLCKNKIELEKRKQMAKDYAEKLQPKINSGVSFAEIAAQDTSKKVLYDSTANFKYSISIPKIGRAPSIVAAAFLLQPTEQEFICHLITAQLGSL